MKFTLRFIDFVDCALNELEKFLVNFLQSAEFISANGPLLRVCANFHQIRTNRFRTFFCTLLFSHFFCFFKAG